MICGFQDNGIHEPQDYLLRLRYNDIVKKKLSALLLLDIDETGFGKLRTICFIF